LEKIGLLSTLSVIAEKTENNSFDECLFLFQTKKTCLIFFGFTIFTLYKKKKKIAVKSSIMIETTMTQLHFFRPK
jgi:hypothetical protein